MTVAFTLLFLTLGIAPDEQQQKVLVRVEVRGAGQPIADARVTAPGIDRQTGADGVVTFEVAPGQLHITVSKPGFLDTRADVDVAAGRAHTVTVDLPEQPAVEEEVTVVASTRTGRRLEDEPVRVEVLGREEIEEKMLMTPGDIVMMLNEMGGMRVQVTSPSIGAASVRVQGMKGRYTRFLSDGLPLFGQQVGGLGLLQIPPMDLGQVEVIKGAVSALYGAGAMGGVVNLLSRRPGPEPVREMLLNRSTLGATDAVAFWSSPLGHSTGSGQARSGVRRSSAAGTGRRVTTSMTMAGRMSRDTVVASCARGSSGMAAAAARHS